jgi:hypothetical protein
MHWGKRGAPRQRARELGAVVKRPRRGCGQEGAPWSGAPPALPRCESRLKMSSWLRPLPRAVVRGGGSAGAARDPSPRRRVFRPEPCSSPARETPFLFGSTSQRDSGRGMLAHSRTPVGRGATAPRPAALKRLRAGEGRTRAVGSVPSGSDSDLPVAGRNGLFGPVEELLDAHTLLALCAIGAIGASQAAAQRGGAAGAGPHPRCCTLAGALARYAGKPFAAARRLTAAGGPARSELSAELSAG